MRKIMLKCMSGVLFEAVFTGVIILFGFLISLL